MKKRALISVSDKTGVVDFAASLAELGYEIISTGGTARALSEAGIKVIGISEITGFPECLDGRVKTLHPNIHAGILAMRSNKEHMEQIKALGVELIDIVCVNLYPFKQTLLKGAERQECIENIDIGGPTVIRAAAKNYQDVAVIVDPEDYSTVINEIKADGQVSLDTKFKLCAKVFEHTAAYDALIASYMLKEAGLNGFRDKLTLTYEKAQDMRYGENPHQGAAFYREIGKRPGSLIEAKQLNGKELSYNNINDTNGALELLREFDEPTIVAVKHANPCGVGSADNIYDAYMKAYESDPVSVFGGIIASNREIDEKTARKMVEIFLEIIVAPSFTEDALEVLKTKKNLRVLELPTINQPLFDGTFDAKKVLGGLLIQDYNDSLIDFDKIEYVTEKRPTDEQMEDLVFAMKVVKHTKSNGIAIAKGKQSLGIGPGQVNRIWPTYSAIERSGEKVKGAVLASDAFFPFDDCVKAAAEAGISCIIQPGGSVNDKLSIDACNKYGIAMIFTGKRHFKH